MANSAYYRLAHKKGEPYLVPAIKDKIIPKGWFCYLSGKWTWCGTVHHTKAASTKHIKVLAPWTPGVTWIPVSTK